MATQSDLEKLRKQLSDLDAKLKSMRGNSPQRNPNFDSAMANQNYDNRMREAFAKLAAERGGQAFPPAFGRPSPEPMINPETIKKARAEYIASQPKNRGYRDVMTNSKYGGQFGSSIGSGFDKWFETNYINNPNSSLTAQERASIIPERRIIADEAGRMQGPQRDPNTGMTFQEMMARQNQPLPPEQATFTPRPQLPQEVRDAIEGRNAAQNQFTQGRLMGAPSDQFGDIARRLEQSGQLPYQQPFNPNAPSLMPIRTPGSDAQNQQMQNYQNLLQQGIQRSNTMNQDAATNFANLQAGAPTTQPASPAKANPVVPIAGMGIQPKATPAPRKFSTVNTPSARFG
jgi:hypothetical protein